MPPENFSDLRVPKRKIHRASHFFTTRPSALFQKHEFPARDYLYRYGDKRVFNGDAEQRNDILYNEQVNFT